MVPDETIGPLLNVSPVDPPDTLTLETVPAAVAALTAVTCPLEFTVTTGMAVEDPNVPAGDGLRGASVGLG
jgi:hypothetical protein